ncbi:hypothetical protein TWF730_000567 [Orbilia blumenaviensis]|uniref:SET domain-containing protein n=1 Tax=Orbilia blumenaviensis TaxID=1796055 RepID=A0AAV9VP15_9PEZI
MASKSYDEPAENIPQLSAIQTIPNKGRGLVATANISPGTRILVEKPFLTMGPAPTPELLERRLSNVLKTLTDEQRAHYHSLRNTSEGSRYPLSGIMRNNALPCGPDSKIGGIYATIGLINHSCVANAHHSWNKTLEAETIHATRDIKAGEEITIYYLTGDTSQTRQRMLKESFGFDCACQLCSLPADKIQASDRRRKEIAILDHLIAYSGRAMTNPDACLKDCRRLIKALEEEYGGGAPTLEARAHDDAFQICLGQGDLARAKVLVEREYRLRVRCEGEDSASSRELKQFVENPRRHGAFGFSMAWRSGITDIPVGLGEEMFEKWLWRL